MKKLVALLLALCMVLGALPVMAESSDTVHVEMGEFSFDLPQGSEVVVLDEMCVDHSYNKLLCWVAGYPITVSVRHECELDLTYYDPMYSGTYSQMVYPYFAINEWDWLKHTEPTLFDGEPAIIAAERLVDQGGYVVRAVLYYDGAALCLEAYDMSLDDEKASVNVLRHVIEPVEKMLSCAYPTGMTAEEVAAAREANTNQNTAPGQEIVLSDGSFSATFQIPDDLVMVDNYMDSAIFENDRYMLDIICFNWDFMGTDITVTGDVQMDNAFYCTAVVFGGQQAGADMVTYILTPGGWEMPGGGDVMIGAVNDYLLLTHYYRGLGFIMILTHKGDGNNWPEMHQVREEVAMSFRLDGMTEEEMRAEAEVFAAAEAEAAAAAAEAAANVQYVVVTDASAKVRSGAGFSYSLVLQAYQGDAFVYLGEEGDWYIIEVDGAAAYVHKGVTAIQ